MGGKSKAVTVGYKYYLGQHLVICHGPIDKIVRARVAERTAWEGSAAGGSINLSVEDIFGGEAREGGVSGTIDVEMGAPTQGQNDYLVSQLGDTVPGYRGVVGLVFRQCYLGNNPYLKKWSFRGQRVYVRGSEGEEQWYVEKAAIPALGLVSASDLAVVLTWQQSSYHASNNDHARMGLRYYDAEGNEIGSDFADMIGTDNLVWTERTLNGTQPAGTERTRVYMEMDREEGSHNDGYIDDIHLTIGGVDIAIQNPSGEDGIEGWTVADGTLAVASTSLTPYDGSFYFDGGGSSFSSSYQDLGVGQIDLNGAHIIREALTDQDWGMGYLDSDIDDVSFEASADILFNESIGLSILWDRQTPIEDFIGEVVKHIDAALYVSRTTGKFVLKLIRDDYDIDDLITLDESNIEKIADPSKPAFTELTNSVIVKYWNAGTGKDASLSITDTAMVQVQGAVVGATLQYPGFSNARNATIAGQRDLRALSSPLLSCVIYANSDAKDLNIGDVFKLSWGKWGVANQVMRVTAIAIGNGRNNQVRITCAQDVFSTPDTVVIANPTTEWTNPSTPPVPLDYTTAFEAPYYELVQALGQTEVDSTLTDNDEIGYVMAAALRKGAAINANLWTDDGSGFESVGGMDFCPGALLSSAVSRTATVLSIESVKDGDLIETGTHLQIDNELCRIDAIDLNAGTITVGRGCLDTVPEPHASGAPIYSWDLNVGFDPTEYVLSEDIEARVAPVSGQGAVSVSDITGTVVTMAQRAYKPYPPGDLQIGAVSYPEGPLEGELVVTWAHRDRLQQTSGTIQDYTYGDIGPEAGTLYRLQGYIDDVLEYTEDDISGTTATGWTPASEGVIRIEVHSKRDGVYSLQGANHEFIYTNGDARISEESDLRITESGDTRITED